MTSPPFTITNTMVQQVATISEQVGRLDASLPAAAQVLLRRGNRIRTIQGSLAIEGNTLSLEQVTAVMDGKRVLGSAREVQEVRGAIAAYEALGDWDPIKRDDLLAAHRVLMAGLVERPGAFRSGNSGIQRGSELVHVAPPAANVRGLINDLLTWLATTEEHPLIAACVFHYEFEFIHPFVDGNGRMGRLWQTLILSRWQPLFALVPVESLIRDQQVGYYGALNTCDAVGNSTAFIEFMLEIISNALSDLGGSPQVSPQVKRLLAALHGSMDRAALQAGLGLTDRKSFRQRYLQPALAAGLIAMTIPDKPNSRLQQYQLTARGRRARGGS
ncbi:MAG: Fic family protein [Planctomycetota bacterium]|nr:MAG: Fic family protein [Planctomycetota bacterium]